MLLYACWSISGIEQDACHKRFVKNCVELDKVMSKEIKYINRSTTPFYISPYEFTKAGNIGKQRTSMLHSELRILPELGRSRQRGHKLPPSHFTYGFKIAQPDGGVAGALSHTQREERKMAPDFLFVRDHFGLNKAALEAGMLTAKDQSRFRTVHDVKKKIVLCDVSRRKQPIVYPDDMVFGLPHKPSTPMGDVLNHRFATKWLEDKQIELEKEQSHTTDVIKNRYHTKASLLRQAKIPVEPKSKRKISEYENTKQQVDTFRSETERRKAFDANIHNSLPHQGISKAPQPMIKT